MRSYKSFDDLDNNGFKRGTIFRVLKGYQNFAYGYYWIRKDKYLTGYYNIPSSSIDKFNVPVTCIEENGVSVRKQFNSIYLASQQYNLIPSEIYRVCIGGRKHVRKTRWIFT